MSSRTYLSKTWHVSSVTTKSTRFLRWRKKIMNLRLRWHIHRNKDTAVKKKTESVLGQIARHNVRQHVTVTWVFQLIRNKRCQQQTGENRCPVQMLFIVTWQLRRMLFKRSPKTSLCRMFYVYIRLWEISEIFPSVFDAVRFSDYLQARKTGSKI